MDEKNNTNSDEKIEEMFLSVGRYMVNKLKAKTESIKKRLEDVKKSGKENKEDIAKKLEELIKVMNNITEKTELQTKTQKELLDLMESMGKLDTEIDDLLLK